VQRAVFGYLNVAVQRLRIAACHPKAAGPQLTPVRIWHEEIGFADITQNRGERMSAIVKSAGDSVATFLPALESIKPVVGFLDHSARRFPESPAEPNLSISWISISGRSTVLSAARHH
jgi:hypothetical protein